MNFETPHKILDRYKYVSETVTQKEFQDRFGSLKYLNIVANKALEHEAHNKAADNAENQDFLDRKGKV